jgi:hypothetical protein
MRLHEPSSLLDGALRRCRPLHDFRRRQREGRRLSCRPFIPCILISTDSRSSRRKTSSPRVSTRWLFGICRCLDLLSEHVHEMADTYTYVSLPSWKSFFSVLHLVFWTASTSVHDSTTRSASEVILKPVPGSLSLRLSCCKTSKSLSTARPNHRCHLQVQSAAASRRRSSMYVNDLTSSISAAFSLFLSFDDCRRWAYQYTALSCSRSQLCHSSISLVSLAAHIYVCSS